MVTCIIALFLMAVYVSWIYLLRELAPFEHMSRKQRWQSLGVATAFAFVLPFLVAGALTLNSKGKR